MKKIINGKKYDTETAKLVSSNNENPFDLEGFTTWNIRCLYVKTNKEYFLTVNRQYDTDQGYRTENNLIPYSLQEAKEFVEFFDNDKYEEIFGEVQE